MTPKEKAMEHMRNKGFKAITLEVSEALDIAISEARKQLFHAIQDEFGCYEGIGADTEDWEQFKRDEIDSK